jgi:hypothetical protein
MLGMGLAGCATIWTHPTKGNQGFYADSAACEATAGQAATANDPFGIVRRRVYNHCMLGKGWMSRQSQSEMQPSDNELRRAKESGREALLRAVQFYCERARPEALAQCIREEMQWHERR